MVITNSSGWWQLPKKAQKKSLEEMLVDNIRKYVGAPPVAFSNAGASTAPLQPRKRPRSSRTTPKSLHKMKAKT